MIKYRGRFAPSPSGPLHFGSLIAALGSWLDAKAHDGEWLVRMEDIDPPREIAGAADDILKTLEQYGLYWDQNVTYQSHRLTLYQNVLEQLEDNNLIYRCICTRNQIKQTGGIYQNICRHKIHSAQTPYSLRLKVNQLPSFFDDLFQGKCQTREKSAQEDFILKRKDHLYAYMLAVVVDDREQQISHVIRGADLLETTAQQLYLFDVLTSLNNKLLNDKRLTQPLPCYLPSYGHLPLAVDNNGLKLSKQNHASAISKEDVGETLWKALTFLKQNPPVELAKEPKENLLIWAVENWQPNNFKETRQSSVFLENR